VIDDPQLIRSDQPIQTSTSRVASSSAWGQLELWSVLGEPAKGVAGVDVGLVAHPAVLDEHQQGVDLADALHGTRHPIGRIVTAPAALRQRPDLRIGGGLKPRGSVEVDPQVRVVHPDARSDHGAAPPGRDVELHRPHPVAPPRLLTAFSHPGATASATHYEGAMLRDCE
jgi:hypothetical protein